MSTPNSDHDRGLTTYLDAMGKHALLDAEAERKLARRMVELRHAMWRTVLSEPTQLETVLARLRGVVSDTSVIQAVDGVVVARVASGSRDPSVASLSSRARIEELARKLTHAGLDPGLVEPLVGGTDHEGDVADAWRERVTRARTELLVIRNRFASANLRLVVALASRHGRQRMSLADRVQEGNLGLLRAIDRYDPERGPRFSTYAAWWIRHSIHRALFKRARLVRVPVHVHALFSKARAARARLRSQTGQDPSDEEVAAEIGVGVATLQSACLAIDAYGVALDEPVAGWAAAPSEALADESTLDVGEALDEARNHALAMKAIPVLDPTQRDILLHRFGLHGCPEMTLVNLGERYGVSRERIRQLQNIALRKLARIIDKNRTPSMAFSVT